jgi:hypothetical protein
VVTRIGALRMTQIHTIKPRTEKPLYRRGIDGETAILNQQ